LLSYSLIFKLATSHIFCIYWCTAIVHHTLTMQPLYRAKTITIKLDNFKHFAETIQQYHA